MKNMKYEEPRDYDKKVRVKTDKTLGYQYFIDKEHPLSSKIGRVYHHRHVASVSAGRWVCSNEHVHHKDGDKSNNDPENLELLSAPDHAREHNHEVGNLVKCLVCGQEFYTTRHKYCTPNCATLGSMRFNPTEEELRDLVWSMPVREVAKRYGVSDVAVHKRCKRLGINKPPRGHWTTAENKR